MSSFNWELDGIASLEYGFDGIGLRIARTAVQVYDWLMHCRLKMHLDEPAQRIGKQRLLTLA